MSIVGPRPEVPHYVAMFTEEEREILTVRPGITDWATFWIRDEGKLLEGSDDPERAYREKIWPEKHRLALEYVRRHSLAVDLQIMLQTLRVHLVDRVRVIGWGVWTRVRRATRRRRHIITGGRMEPNALTRSGSGAGEGPAVALRSMYATMLRIRLFEERVAELVEAARSRRRATCTSDRRRSPSASAPRWTARLRLGRPPLPRALPRERRGPPGADGRDVRQGRRDVREGGAGRCTSSPRSVGIFGTVPLVAATVPLAVGAGLASKLRGDHLVSVPFFGDGAVEEGHVHESLNLAAVYHLPVVFVCENNLYASHMHLLERRAAGQHRQDRRGARAPGHGAGRQRPDRRPPRGDGGRRAGAGGGRAVAVGVPHLSVARTRRRGVGHGRRRQAAGRAAGLAAEGPGRAHARQPDRPRRVRGRSRPDRTRRSGPRSRTRSSSPGGRRIRPRRRCTRTCSCRGRRFRSPCAS